jgi:hypothetical protein
MAISGDIKKLFNLDKQIIFAAAQALTFTAKDAQTAVIENITANFIVRGKWYLPSNAFGVKVTRATKQNLSVEVKSKADWLILQQTGGTKSPKRKAIAVPTTNVRRTKRDIIQKGQRPRNLKNAFIIKTSKGPALARRTGKKRYPIKIMYFLEPNVKIRKRRTFFEPVSDTFKRRFFKTFADALANAVKSAKTG